MIDVDGLLQSFGEEAPSGDDLEYDPVFVEMTLAAQPGEERQVGDSIIGAEEPDFADVAEKARAVLERSRDLRASVILANAALRLEGLPAFEEVLRYIRGAVEDYWDTCHPQLDAEDDDDPTMRVNAVLGLTDPTGVLRSLRLAPLTMSRTFGRFGLRDLQIAEGEIAPPADMDQVPDMSAIGAAFQDTDPEALERLSDAADAIAAHVKAIGEAFDSRIGALGPDLKPLEKMVYEIRKRLSAHAGTEGAAAEDEGVAEVAPGAPAGSSASVPDRAASGAIAGPSDVTAAIDRIIDYYARSEPSSPVPLLLKRARRLVSADFMTIMRDMAPHGVDQVSLIGGLDSEE